MNDEDIRALTHPDHGMTAERRQAVKEQVMSEITSGTTSRRPVLGSFRRRLVPALASVLILGAAGTGIAAALGLFPGAARDTLEEFGCRTGGSVEELVAEDSTAGGQVFEYWVTRPDEGQSANGDILVERQPDGSESGFMVACSEPGQAGTQPPVWASAASEMSASHMLLAVMGHAPAEAVEVLITLNDGTTVRTETQVGGYFLELVERPGPGEDAFASDSFDPPDPVHLIAFDAMGNTVADLRVG